MANVATRTITYWLPLITAVLGFAAGGFTEWIRDRRSYTRERQASESARRDARIERRNEFQRKTLLELQDNAIVLMQTTASMQQLDMTSLRKYGKRDVESYPANVTKDNEMASAQTARLGVRVQDATVRDLLQQFKKKLSAALFAPGIEESESAMQDASTSFVALNVRIGEVLRALDDFECPM